jgi:glycosyltransferase involved in cell wall biosynthesis
VRITLLDSAYLMPSLVMALTEADFVVAPSPDGSLEVLTPWVPGATDAAAVVAVHVNRWAALHGAQVVLDPAPTRIAHPTLARHEVQEGRSGSSRPTVSIGVPVYNGARYLEETLDSLVSQTFGDIEILVCDNGSTDSTARIVRAFASRDERISLYGSPANRGAAWNYNRTLTLAQGRYFKWAAHDDLCAPTYIERCVEVLDRAPDSVVLAYPKTVIIDQDGQFVRNYEDMLDLRQKRPHERVAAVVRNVVMSNAVFGVIRTDALRRTGGHGSYISADYVLLAELALAGQFWEIPEPLFLRREHSATSRAAQTSPADLANWFRPGSGDVHTTEFVRLFAEYLGAVREADLGRVAKLAVYTGTVPVWLRRFGRSMSNELLRQAALALHLGGAGRSVVEPDTSARPLVAVPPPMSPTVERVVVHDIVRRVIWQVAPDFVPHIRIHVDPSTTIDADPAALEIVLTNLISNAVRYGDVPIVVSAAVEDEFVLTVNDAGRGVAEAFVPSLFEPFARSPQSQDASEGAGLGLAIARMTAETSGGALVYEPSEVGARFRLSYPGSVLSTPDHRQPPATYRHSHRVVRASGASWSGAPDGLQHAA